MKRYLSVLLFALILFIAVPISSVFAAPIPGNKLIGSYYGFTSAADSPNSVTYNNLITAGKTDVDGNDATTNNASSAYWYYVKLSSTPTTITNIRFYASQAVTFAFYDGNSNTRLSTYTIAANDPSYHSINVPNVKIAAFHVNTSATVNEWYISDVIQVPSIPLALTATPGNADVALSWTASPNATSFSIKRSTTAGGPYTTVATNVNGSTYTDTTVTNDTTYYYVVSALNAAGESGDSNMASATPTAPEVPLPNAPIDLIATSGNAQVSLNWTAVSGATGYNVKRSTTAGGPYTSVASNATGSPYTDTAVTNGTTYYYIVTAINTIGESANSTEVPATPQAPLPATPTTPILTGQSGNAQNTLTWTASSGATSYDVKRSTTPTGPYTTITSSVYSNVYSTYTDTSVVNGTTYYYVVSAINAGGSSANSNEVSLKPQAPLEPTLNIVIAEEKVKVGQEFTANVELKDVTNIYAEDFTVKYDNTIFDYLGFETVTGYQVYNQPTDQNGTLRFIIASQGVNYGITGEKTFVKLKLRAKAVGVGKVDAVKCRIADIDHEFDLGDPSCGEDTVTVENQDVNRNGEYTLLDLAIDGYYYGQLATNANPAIYTAHQAGNEYVDDDDLLFIVKQMLLNTNYAPNL